MDHGVHNSHHLYPAPQPVLHPQPQPQPQQPAATHLYSYYSIASTTPYPSQIVRYEDPSPAALDTNVGAVSAAEHYAMDSGYDGHGLSYVGLQPYQLAAPHHCAPLPPAADVSYYLQAKRKLKIQSKVMDLETKKQRLIDGGAAADAVRVCAVCNVVCNSDKVFASHLAGDKHVHKALGRTSHAMVPKGMAHMPQMSNARQSIPQAFGTSGALKIVQRFVCEVCKIECNNQEALNSHKRGKKHMGKLQKLQQAIVPKPSATSLKNNLSAVEATKQSLVTEDVETKKENVLKCGAALDAIKICSICNVVCNSETVYNFHIAGKKHLSMIKKQAM